MFLFMLCVSEWRNSSSQKKNAQMRDQSLAGRCITLSLKMAVDGSRTEEATLLGSELTGDGSVEPPCRDFEGVPVRDETAVAVEPFHPRQSPESVVDCGGAPSKALTAGKKQRVNISTRYLTQILPLLTVQHG